MRRTWEVARREFAAYFNSPIAYVFLFAFAGSAAFTVFNLQRFFARGAADLRGLFSAIPLLLLILVPALTMRLWAEERKLGTIEILMTLPARKLELVLGKFLASWLLVSFALALTLPFAITLAILGDPDWGPITGAYIGALLLAAAYLAVGQFVSALTENQILAFIGALLGCVLLYGVGTTAFEALFPDRIAVILHALGSGARFESIARGVVDLRDVAYYVSLAVVFNLASVVAVEGTRTAGERGPARRRARRLGVAAVLATLNIVAFNIILAKAPPLRFDLTAERRYTISNATSRLVTSLDEPVEVIGYFSTRTHPKLAPLVPEIVDLLEEYKAVSGGRVRYRILSPDEDPEIEREARELFGVTSTPFQFASKYESSLVNAYFAVVIRYGDRHFTYTHQDLVSVSHDKGEADVRLRNLEYDITRAIRKASTGLTKQTDLINATREPISLTIVMTPASLPPRFQHIPEIVRAGGKALLGESFGRVKFFEVAPPTDAAAIDQTYREFGVRPMRADYPDTGKIFYLYGLVTIGERVERINIAREDLTAAVFRDAFNSVMRRGIKGLTPTVGVFSPDPAISRAELAQYKLPPTMPKLPEPEYETARRMLSADYDVVNVNLRSVEVVPDDVDVLLVLAPRNLSEREVYKLDQYLMRGGRVVICASNYNLEGKEEMKVVPVRTGLEEWLAHYGIEISKTLLLDDRNQAVPIPSTRATPGSAGSWDMKPFPYLLRVEKDGFPNPDVVGNLRSIGLYWASPVVLRPNENAPARFYPILRSSSSSWTDPDLTHALRIDYTVPPVTEPRDVAIALDGQFRGYYAARTPPAPLGNPEVLPLRSSVSQSPSTRLVVIGNSTFLSDFVAATLGRGTAGFYQENFRFLQNLVDWTLLDSEMISIRSRGVSKRRLDRVSNERQLAFEAMNYVAPLFLLLCVAVARSAIRARTPGIAEDRS